MSHKIKVRFGGATGATVHDYSDRVRLYLKDGSRGIFGGMHFNNGDASTGELPLMDWDSAIPLGDANNLQVYGRNKVTWIEDSPGYDALLSVGRIAMKYWARPNGRAASVAHEARVQWDDVNNDFHGLTLTAKRVRPEETALARMQWVIESWCQGDPRDSTNITFATETDGHLVGEGTGFDNVMDAYTYPRGTPIFDIIQECNDRAGKIFGVVIHQDADGNGDHECFEWIGETNHTTYVSDLSISDVVGDVDYETTFYPVWRNDLAATEDPSDFLSGVVLNYGTDGDDAVVVTDPDLVDQFDYWVIPYSFDRAQSAVWATQRAQNILDAHGKEAVTIQPSLLIPNRLHPKLRAGMSISIRSDAAFGGEDQGTAQMKRISNIEWEPAGINAFGEECMWANLQLDQPPRILTQPDPHEDMGPQPPGGNCTDLTGGRELDTFAEHNTTGHWNSNQSFADFTSDLDNDPPVVGSWMVGYSNVGTAANNFMYYAFTGTFTAGKRYTFGFWLKSDKVEAMTAYFGATDTISTSLPAVFTADGVTLSITADGEWHHYEMEWTPAATTVADGSNATAVNVRWGLDSTGSAGGYVFADGGTLEECTDAAIPPASDDGTGSSGDDCTEYACADHKHPWQTAAHTPITDSGGYYTSDNVEGALQEIGAAGGTPYTDEDAQDAVGTILTDSSTVDFTYTDATPAITAAVIPGGIKLDDLGAPDDNTDLNASTSAHGLLPKLPGGTTTFFRADGTFATPAGGSGSLTVEEVDGSPTDSAVTKLIFPNGTLSITSHEATYTPSGGGGGVTQAYIGNNNIGASWASAVGGSMYLVPFTLAEGRTIASISAYWKGNSSNVPSWRAAVLSDSAGSPSQILAAAASAATTLYMDSNGRWMALAIGEYFAAGNYWLAVQPESSVLSIAYDSNASSTHRTYDVGAYFLKDPSLGGNGIVDPDRDFSIRANTIR